MVSKVRGSFETFSGAITIAGDGTLSVSANHRRQLHRHPQRAARRARAAPRTFSTPRITRPRTFVSTSVRPDERRLHPRRRLHPERRDQARFLKLGVWRREPRDGAGAVAGFEASVVLNRKDFGIDIDMPLETSGTVIGDKVTITLEIEALKQA